MPVVREHASLSEALAEISSKGLGMTSVVDNNNRVIGIFTDGDLRRLLDHGEVNIQNLTITDVMNPHFITATADMLAAEALQMMDSKRINALPVVDSDHRLVGAINMHELLRAGIV